MIDNSTKNSQQSLASLCSALSVGDSETHYFLDSSGNLSSFTLTSAMSFKFNDQLYAGEMYYQEEGDSKIRFTVSAEPEFINVLVKNGYQAIQRYAFSALSEEILKQYGGLLADVFFSELMDFLNSSNITQFRNISDDVKYIREWVKLQDEPIVEGFRDFVDYIKENTK